MRLSVWCKKKKSVCSLKEKKERKLSSVQVTKKLCCNGTTLLLSVYQLQRGGVLPINPWFWSLNDSFFQCKSKKALALCYRSPVLPGIWQAAGCVAPGSAAQCRKHPSVHKGGIEARHWTPYNFRAILDPAGGGWRDMIGYSWPSAQYSWGLNLPCPACTALHVFEFALLILLAQI